MYQLKDGKADANQLLFVALNIYIESLMKKIPYKDRENGFLLNLLYRKIWLEVKAVRAYKNDIEHGVDPTPKQLALLESSDVAEVLAGWNAACSEISKKNLLQEEKEGGGGPAMTV